MKKQKTRKLFIGIGILMLSLIIYISVSEIQKKNEKQLSQNLLNSLVKDIEFYKNQNGKYPESLQQLEKRDDFVFNVDPIQGKANSYYNYVNLGNKYLLFSSGFDGIQNTTDDLYPKIVNLKNVGWTKSRSNPR
jgi:type II secretory pathway pseudopilin PulG